MSKKLLLWAVIIIVIVGAIYLVVYQQKNTPNQSNTSVPDTTSNHDVAYYVTSFNSAPQVNTTKLQEKEPLQSAFSADLTTVKCDPENEKDENSMCCNVKAKTFTATADFYALESTNWEKGGEVEFYIGDPMGGCADGRLAQVRGPFKGNLLELSKQASSTKK